MAENIVTIGETDVEIRETEDGFEAVEHEPSLLDQFKSDTGAYEGYSLGAGTIESLNQQMYGDTDVVKVSVSRPEFDLMSSFIDKTHEAGWRPVKIEFEYGYVYFVQFE